VSNKLNSILIPNVTRTPGNKQIDKSNQLPKEGEISEFKELLSKKIESEKPLHGGINLSSHAAQRLQERKIDFNGEEYAKVKEAMARLKEKGGQNSLIISDKAAYIVDVKNNKVVTAVDKENMMSNVFTKIDSTVFIN